MLKCSALAKLKKKLKTDANQKWFWNGFEIAHSNWGGICKYGLLRLIQSGHKTVLLSMLIKNFTHYVANIEAYSAWKMSVFGVFLVRTFSHSDWVRTRKTMNTDTSHAVLFRTLSNIFGGALSRKKFQSPYNFFVRWVNKKTTLLMYFHWSLRLIIGGRKLIPRFWLASDKLPKQPYCREKWFIGHIWQKTFIIYFS